MCIAPSGASRRGKSRPELGNFHCFAGTAGTFEFGARNGLTMARAGLTYVAMTAAAISAAALGYAVIWSYNESATPAVMTLAPPVKEMAPRVAQELKPDIARSSPAASADAPPISPPVASKHELPREVAPAPANPPRSADTIPLPPEQRSEKPMTASAPKDPTTVEFAALPALPRSESPALRAAEKPVAAQPATPISAP